MRQANPPDHSRSMNLRSRPSAEAVALLGVVAVAAMAAARAWVCDDAFITFRVVNQFLAGEGPVFNIGERVQVFTHPLWFMLLCLWKGLGGSLFPGVMLLSWALFSAGLVCIYSAFKTRSLVVIAVFVALFFTRAIADFATGGLEAPLSFALFAVVILSIRRNHHWAAVAFLSLIPLNRLDLLPWILPFAWLIARSIGRVRTLVIAVLPATLWAGFSLLYYGTPLPNTALAKLGAPLVERLDQGLAYVAASLLTDPGASVIVLLGMTAGVLAARRPPSGDRDLQLAGAASGAISIAYCLWVGGDFMLGRFILPALWSFSVAMLCAGGDDETVERRGATATFLLLALAHLVSGQAITNLWLGIAPDNRLRGLGYAGAIDERRFYIPWLGAFSRHAPSDIAQPMRSSSSNVTIAGRLGVDGYYSSLQQPLIDTFALADPMLARVKPLPAARPGHAYRPLRRDIARWRNGEHAFGDPGLDAVASDLRLAHLSRPLLSVERFAAIARLLPAPKFDLHGVEISRDRALTRISLDPALLFRMKPPSLTNRVWLRLYDRGLRAVDPGITPIDRYPGTMVFNCGSRTLPSELNSEESIAVPAGERLSFECDSELFRDGLLMRVGAQHGSNIVWDEVTAILRPRLWWTASVRRWLLDGWRSRPWPPLAAAALLLLAAGAIRVRHDGGRGRADQ